MRGRIQRWQDGRTGHAGCAKHCPLSDYPRVTIGLNRESPGATRLREWPIRTIDTPTCRRSRSEPVIPQYRKLSPGAGYLEYFISAITLVFLLGLSAFGLLFLAAGGFLVASSQVLRLGFQLGFGRLPRVLDCFVAHSFLHDRVAIVTINQSRRDKLQAES